MSTPSDIPPVGADLTAAALDRLHNGACLVCGACDEYDTAYAGTLWYCLACPAQFELVLGRRGGIKSGTRIADSEGGE